MTVQGMRIKILPDEMERWKEPQNCGLCHIPLGPRPRDALGVSAFMELMHLFIYILPV